MHQDIQRGKNLDNETSLDSIIEEVRTELKSMLMKKRKLIEKLGFAFEKVVANAESVCEEIKNCLKEEIEKGLISTRTIEQSCLSEWKKKTKPKLENEKISFSDDKPQREEEKKRKIAIDTQGKIVHNPVSYTTDYSNNSYHKDDFRKLEKQIIPQDNEILPSPDTTIRELIYENKKIREEKDRLIDDLEEAIQTISMQKQKESELVKNYQNITTQLNTSGTVFEAEFSVDYRSLQGHMQEIFKSTVRQEVWFAAKIDANRKRVISVQIGRKLVQE